MFILTCPHCGSILYQSVKRLCPEIPDANRTDVYCRKCGWVGRTCELEENRLETELEEDEVETVEEDPDFHWEVEK